MTDNFGQSKFTKEEYKVDELVFVIVQFNTSMLTSEAWELRL